jgi:hypothetical protein
MGLGLNRFDGNIRLKTGDGLLSEVTHIAFECADIYIFNGSAHGGDLLLVTD